MVIDIILFAIFIASLVLGYMKGFMNSVLHTFGWILAIIFAYLLNDTLTNFTMTNTSIYEYIQSTVTENVNLDPVLSIELIPQMFHDGVEKVESNLTDFISTNIFSVFMFIASLALIKVVIYIISRLLSKKHNNGLMGFTDGLLGLALGVIRGVILVLLILALLYPILSFISQDNAEIIMNEMNNSVISKYLYENNPLLIFIGNPKVTV